MHIRYLITALITAICSATATAAEAADSLRVLFIGNSYTYYHEMPRMVAEMGGTIGSSPKINIAYTQITPGGWSLQRHWEGDDVQKALRRGCWDYVVIQENSSLPARPSTEVARDTYTYAWKIDSLAKAENPGVTTIMYMTWGHKDGCLRPVEGYPMIDTYAGMQQRLIQSYLEMAYMCGAECAPVGMAWQQFRAEHPYDTLYWPDGTHPSVLGSYLAANVIFATITQRPYQCTYTAGLEPRMAEYVQQLAQRTVFDNRRLLNIK